MKAKYILKADDYTKHLYKNTSSILESIVVLVEKQGDFYVIDTINGRDKLHKDHLQELNVNISKVRSIKSYNAKLRELMYVEKWLTNNTYRLNGEFIRCLDNELSIKMEDLKNKRKNFK